jgi:hypothetical protein
MASLEIVRHLLAHEPTIYDFGVNQTAEERLAMLHTLSSAERRAVLHIVISISTECYGPLETEEQTLERLMSWIWDAEREYYHAAHEYTVSDDWRLRVFTSPDGALYDFNGWPGDNENGRGIFCPIAGGPPIVIFRNSDECLQPVDPALGEIIAEYSERRTQANQDQDQINAANDLDYVKYRPALTGARFAV